MNTPTLVDLFSGCGGFSLGAELAGFHSILAVDIDSTLQSGFTRNFPNARTVQADIADLGAADWRQLLDGNRPTGVIGGPPCQGFSRIGKKKKDDPRNSLVGHFFRCVRTINPDFFLMENVEGLLDHDCISILEAGLELVSHKYNVLEPIIVKASDYGAPTMRTRVVVFGYRSSEIGPFESSDFLPADNTAAPTVEDAISDLPEPILTSRKDDDYAWSRYKDLPFADISAFAKRARKLPPKGLGWKKSLEYLRDRICSGNEITIHSSGVAGRYGSLAPGQVDPVSKSSRLKWDGVCTTLRAGTGGDKGSHQAVRPIHPEQARVITVREAARLQGFPDWFVFHHTKWHSFRMLGNSVSPVVSNALLSSVGRNIDSLNLDVIQTKLPIAS